MTKLRIKELEAQNKALREQIAGKVQEAKTSTEEKTRLANSNMELKREADRWQVSSRTEMLKAEGFEVDIAKIREELEASNDRKNGISDDVDELKNNISVKNSAIKKQSAKIKALREIVVDMAALAERMNNKATEFLTKLSGE